MSCCLYLPRRLLAYALLAALPWLTGAPLAYAQPTQAVVQTAQAEAPAPPALVPWGSAESMERLARSTAKAGFFALTNHFEPQENPVFCGPASATIVLNALRLERSDIEKPRDDRTLPAEDRTYLPKTVLPFARYTQRSVLTESPKSLAQVLGEPVELQGKKQSDYGFQLRAFADLLVQHGLNATLHVAVPALTDGTIRKAIRTALGTEGTYVVVNYDRKPLGQKGAGHIAPLGAYDDATDSVLILDVNPNAHGWVWVPLRTLITAMRDRDVHEPRGYVIVREGTGTVPAATAVAPASRP